jgi:hypothetical protein
MRHALNVLLAIHAMHAYIIAPTVRVALNMRSRLARCTAIRPAIGALMCIVNRPGYLEPMANDCCGGDLSGNACKSSASGHLRGLQMKSVHIWLADNF